MIFSQECVVPVECERLWDFLMEVPKVARCVPGVETVAPVARGPADPAGDDAYTGTLKVQVGPIRLGLQGTMTIEERDRTAWRARMRAEATDRRVAGGIRARLSLALTPTDGGTRLQIETDLTVLGKIGEFGQPVIKKKADGLLTEFAANLRTALGAA